ncbi:MAG: hypothetical protein AB7D33_03460 [Sphingobium sp.]
MMQKNKPPVPTVAKTPKRHLKKPVPMSEPLPELSAEIATGHPKISVPVATAALPFNCFIPEPERQPPVTLRLRASTGVELRATIAGKSFRRTMKAIIADGAVTEGHFVVVQGRLAPHGLIEEAGLVYAPKTTTTQAPA